MDLSLQSLNLLLEGPHISVFQRHWHFEVQKGQQLSLGFDQITTPKFILAPSQQIHEFGCSKLMDLSSNKDDSGSSESDLCLVDVKFEIAEYVQADEVGIY